jgi:hypothetical protein
MLAVQTHVDACAGCAELLRFHRALRQSLQRAVESDSLVSESLEARIRDALAREARAEAERPRSPRYDWQRLSRVASLVTVPLAAAAGLWLWMGAPAPSPQSARDAASPQNAEATLGSEELLDRLIDYHSSPPAPQVTEPSLIPQLERDVGVRVRLPSLMDYGAHWQGASVVRVRPDQRAAYLRYRTLDDHSVTVYVYNASRMPLHAGLQPRLVRGDEPVYVGNRRGYSIAAQLRNGVGYAVASDLESGKSAELVHMVSSGGTVVH